MATNTARWALRKPAAADTVSATLDIGGPYDIIDGALGSTVCTSGTRPGAPVQGQTIYETDTKRMWVWSGTVWLNVSQLAKVKTTDLTKNANTTLTDDTELVLPVLASTTYLVRAVLIYSSATAADAKIGLTVPASATWQLAPFGQPVGASVSAGTLETAVSTASGIVLGGIGVGTKIAALVTGTIVVAGTAGTVAVSFAQQTSTASNTLLHIGSSLELVRST